MIPSRRNFSRARRAIVMKAKNNRGPIFALQFSPGARTLQQSNAQGIGKERPPLQKLMERVYLEKIMFSMKNGFIK